MNGWGLFQVSRDEIHIAPVKRRWNAPLDDPGDLDPIHELTTECECVPRIHLVDRVDPFLPAGLVVAHSGPN